MPLLMEKWLKGLRHYISPAFLVLLVASFILWYISKLSYTYVTEQQMHLVIDEQPVEVVCVVEGLGTNLFANRFHADRTLRIPLEELRFEPSHEAGHEGKLRIDPFSLQQAITLRCSDIKIISVGAIPEIDQPSEP